MKKIYRISTIALLAALPAIAFAGPPSLPSGGAFVVGSGTIAGSGNTETVTIGRSSVPTPTVITWSGGYDVAAGSTISYATAGGGSAPGGVVVDNDPSGAISTIAGTIVSPNYAQVVVNPDGVTIAGSAVLPQGFAAVAGHPNLDGGPITATAGRITVAPGVTITDEIDQSQAGGTGTSITVIGSNGTTMPYSTGLTTDLQIPAGSTLRTYDNQTGSYTISGPSGASAGAVTIDGTGSTPGSIAIDGTGSNIGSLAVENIDSTGDVQIGSIGDLTPIAAPVSISNVSAGGAFGVGVDSTFGVDASGAIAAPSATGAVDLTAQAVTLPPPFTSPPSSPDPTVSIAGGTILSGGGGFGSDVGLAAVSLSGDTVSIAGPITAAGGFFQIESDHAIVGATGASISNPASALPGAVQSLAGPAPANRIYAPAISDIGISTPGAVEIDANSISGLTGTTGSLAIDSARYESDPSTADGATLVFENSNIGTGDLGVNGAFGVTIGNVVETAPAPGSTYPNLHISADATAPNSAFTSASDGAMSIVNSTLYGDGATSIEAGIARPQAGFPGTGGSISLPGSVSISGSTITVTGQSSAGLEPQSPFLTIDAAGGGSISIDKSSVLSTNGAGACAASGSCSISLIGASVSFGSGNRETASGSVGFSGSASGAANSDPAATAGSSSGAGPGISLETYRAGNAPVGSISVSGYLDAGSQPAVVVPPLTTPPTTPINTPPATTPPVTITPVTVAPVTTPPVTTPVITPPMTRPVPPHLARPAPAPSAVHTVSIPPITEIVVSPSAGSSTVHGNTVILPGAVRKHHDTAVRVSGDNRIRGD